MVYFLLLLSLDANPSQVNSFTDPERKGSSGKLVSPRLRFIPVRFRTINITTLIFIWKSLSLCKEKWLFRPNRCFDLYPVHEIKKWHRYILVWSGNSTDLRCSATRVLSRLPVSALKFLLQLESLFSIALTCLMRANQQVLCLRWK